MKQAFETTRWSVVLRARDRNGAGARRAMEALCTSYWSPLYAFARRRGHDPDAAADLVQSYFARFLEKDYLRSVQPSAGRFRSFLLASLQHFLLNEWDRARAGKRGGGVRHISIEPHEAEATYAQLPALDLTPEQLYERRWALTVLERVTATLREEHAKLGKTAVFDHLHGFLTGEGLSDSYRAAGEHLGMSEGAVKVAVHRLRKRFGEELRREIGDTVADADEVDDEIRHLLLALA